MSVQLIVFPQSYDGQFSSLSTTANELVVDGINFNTINTSSSYGTPSLLQTAIDNQPPSSVNTWYRYRTTGSGTPTLPTTVSGNLTLYSVSTQSLCGVYQKLSNLVVGNAYDIVIDISTTGTGLIVPTIYDGSTFIAATIFSAGSSQVTYSFTATSVNQIIVISYSNTTADNIVISNVSVLQQGITPTSIYTDLQNGQVICDLYEDEDIPLSLSIDDFKNVAEQVQSYSKAFNLPATKRNNKIFDNIFEVTRTDTGLNFNPYKKTKCILKQDGFLLFEGYLRLIDIQDKEGEISYNVNLYSEVIALADVLAERTFSDLDFSELEHDYNYTEIRNSWQGLLTVAPLPITSYANNTGVAGATTTNVLKYPFIDWTHQYTLNANGPVLPSLESSFRPFIKLKYLINRIFEATPFTYESAFFDTADFEKLFMDFNWGSANAPVVIGLSTYDLYWTKADDSPPASVYAGTFFTNLVLRLWTVANIVLGQVPPNYDLSTNIITATADGEQYNITGDYNIENTSATDTIDVECQWIKNTSVVITQTLTMLPSSSALFNFTFSEMLMNGDTLQAQFKRVDPASANTIRMNEAGLSDVTFNVNTVAMTSATILQTLRGEVGQWDFLKGIMTMFNLVSMTDSDNPNQINIEPYADVFINNADSTELDWTEKIDVSEMKLTPLTELNKKTIFKFVEDEDDYSFNKYKNDIGGYLYGSKKYDASGFTILAGEDEIVAEPFAATVIKPLDELFPNFITPAVYSMNEDGTSEGFENSPRIMYDNGIKTLTSCTYNVPAQNGVSGDAFEDEFLQFSHLSTIPTATGTLDFHFGQCQLLNPVGSSVPDNLFNLYWLPYYNELYNPDTRIMDLKVNLSPSDINIFKMYDTVFIKNRTFRVNKIDYKPNDLATVEFILIP